MIVLLKRIKNDKGIIEAYEIEDIATGVKSIVNPLELVKKHKLIQNAILLKNGEFRAKQGYKIGTEVKYMDNVSISMNSVIPKRTNSSTFKECYYGKEFINICRKIRRLAYADRIIIDKTISKHSSNAGNNVHLIETIEACGVSIKEFIRGYLSVIQPFCFETFQKKKVKDNSDVWLCDIGYRVKLVIEISNINNSEAMLVSFHESNIVRGTGITQSLGMKDFSDKPCAVMVDKCNEFVGNNGSIYEVAFSIQRGFIRDTLNYKTKHYNKGIALIDYKDIKERYQSKIDKILDNLMESYYDGSSIIDIKMDMGKVSFLSIGYSPINNICLMVDCFNTYTGKNDRLVIMEVVNNLLSEMPLESVDDLKRAISSKFGRIVNYDNQLYTNIMSFE